jgi:hypothetical protein
MVGGTYLDNEGETRCVKRPAYAYWANLSRTLLLDLEDAFTEYLGLTTFISIVAG